MENITQAVILAGGKGVRLKPFTDTSPKPMFEIHGIPFLKHLLLQVKSFGITDIILLLGYLPDKIIDYFGDGETMGLNITYSVTNEEYDTGKRLYKAKELIKSDFLLMYCDNYCPLNFSEMKRQFYRSKAHIQITAYNNSDGYTKNNLKLAQDGLILAYDKKRLDKGLSTVDIGYAIINHSVLNLLINENFNFESFVYPKLIEEKKMYAYCTEHRYYSIGSYERIERTKTFFSNQKIAFVDRDGTLNVKAPKACYITKPDDFIWLEKAREAIKLLNDNNYKVFLITNQPGIARGELSLEDLEAIHGKMLSELKEVGAKVDKIYMCLHNWNDGCECRKPKPKMLFDAQKDFDFNMKDAIFFGDDIRDMEAAKVAGCEGIFVNDEFNLYDAVNNLLLNFRYNLVINPNQPKKEC